MEFLGPLTLATIPAFLLLDFVVRKRHYQTPRHWRLQGFLVTGAIFFITGEVAYMWGIAFEGYSLFDLSDVAAVPAAIIGILIYELVHYWYHRKAHQWNWLWRAGHQMHHSAESLDAFGAFYGHPFDSAMFTTWSSLVFFPLLGLSPEAGAIGALFLTFNAMFQHANIATPRWLGYIIQRPESHCVHHGRGIHRYNYSDLPLWDIVFGTFRNPGSVDAIEIGFYNGASLRIPEMLIGRDVSAPPVVGAGEDRAREHAQVTPLVEEAREAA